MESHFRLVKKLLNRYLVSIFQQGQNFVFEKDQKQLTPLLLVYNKPIKKIKKLFPLLFEKIKNLKFILLLNFQISLVL